FYISLFVPFVSNILHLESVLNVVNKPTCPTYSVISLLYALLLYNFFSQSVTLFMICLDYILLTGEFKFMCIILTAVCFLYSF
ncbi:hypothetical protein L9F63_010367, partial [Diploptera punctata]